MPGPIYESISSYRPDDRFSLQTGVKKKTSPVPPKKECKSIENSRLAGIAKGGKWVLFALLYLPCFLLIGLPRWIRCKVWKRGVLVFRSLNAKVSQALEGFYRKLTYPFVALKKGIKRGLHLALQPFIRLQKGIKWLAQLISSAIEPPLRGWRRAKGMVSSILLRIGKLNFSFKLPKIPKIKLPAIRIKFPKIHIPTIRFKFKPLRLPKLPSLPKFPKFTFKIKPITLPKWKFTFRWPKINIKLPKIRLNIKIPRFNIKIPSVNIKLPKMPKLPKLPSLDLSRVEALFTRVGSAFSSRAAFIAKWVKAKLFFFTLILNGLSLLVEYWAEQVREMLAESFKFD